MTSRVDQNPTLRWPVSTAVVTSGFHPEGHRFESDTGHLKTKYGSQRAKVAGVTVNYLLRSSILLAPTLTDEEQSNYAHTMQVKRGFCGLSGNCSGLSLELWCSLGHGRMKLGVGSNPINSSK